MTQPPPAIDRERSHRILAAFQRLLAAVLAMRSGDDLEAVPPVIWNELRGLDVDLLYCGLGLVDEEAGTFRYFGFSPKGILKSRVMPLAEVVRGSRMAPPFFSRQAGGPVVVHRRVTPELITGWMEHLNRAGGEIEGFPPGELPDELEAAEVPFGHGFLIVSRSGRPFSADELDIFARLADLFSVGYARFLDFERLDRQNRVLRLAAAVDQVHHEVGHMERSHDWGRVVRVLGDQLRMLGVQFNGCSLNVIDEEAGLFRQNMVLPRIARQFAAAAPSPLELVTEVDEEQDLWSVDRKLEPGRVPSPDALEAWKERRVLIRRLSEEEREERFLRGRRVLGFSPEAREQFPRSTLDVPFEQGLIALTSPRADAFGDEEVEMVREFASVIDTGYRRWLDIRRIEETNRALMETQAQLVQSAKMAAMGELVAGIAHEINTPLGAVKATTDILKRLVDRLEPAAGDDERVKQVRELIKLNESSVARMTSIVRDLRDFARLDEAELQEADLHEGINSTLNLIQHETRDRIEVVREFGDLPRIRCYPGRLNQVFMNLLKNAVQAIEGRGTIVVRTRHDGDKVEVSVSDDGRGISDGHLTRVFDPGFTTKGRGVGTGLGLAISARILEEHGGRITVESDPGKGSTFTLELPLRPPVAGAGSSGAGAGNAREPGDR